MCPLSNIEDFNFEQRTDDSNPLRKIFGKAPLNTAETDAAWQIYAIDTVGQRTHTRFAESPSGIQNDRFVHKWSERADLFPPVPFENNFSVQFRNDSDSGGIVPDSNDLDFTNDGAFSAFVWIKTVDTSSQTFFQKSTAGSGSQGYTFEMDGAQRLIVNFRNAGLNRLRVRTDSPTKNLADGSWHLVGFTKAASPLASGLKVYIDGVAQTLNVLNDNLTSSIVNAEPLTVGKDYNSGTPRFAGNMDELALWNANLSEAEVLEIYNSNAGVIDLAEGSGQIASGLVAWWRFGDGSFTELPTISDEVGTNDMILGSAVVGGDLESEVPP